MNEIMNVILNCTNCNRVSLADEFHLEAQVSFSLDFDLFHVIMILLLLWPQLQRGNLKNREQQI